MREMADLGVEEESRQTVLRTIGIHAFDVVPNVRIVGIRVSGASRKLGARELNVASDLDLLFVYEGEGAQTQRRASELAEQVLRGVRDAGWEPDADLRPEGRNGPLARSIAGYLEYWQRYAETWEFQALLRTRAIAGDADLGRRFESNAADAAYPPDGLTVDRVADIRRMRERIERERVKPPEAAKFHFKLGIGAVAAVQVAVEL
jgi:glutamate-ammonia-ligase adenylyltransferase